MRVSLRWITITALALPVAGCALFEKRDDSPTVASGEGFEITLDELDAWVKESLFEEQTGGGDPSRLYQVRSQALDALVRERVLTQLAEAEGKTIDEMLAAQPVEVSDAEVEAFYQANRARIGDATLEQVGPAIRGHLEEQARREQVESLVQGADISVSLEPPRFEVAAAGPARGPEDAPVTIIEFSDFQCPFCKRVLPTLEQLFERYPDQIRLVYRHLPLESIHPQARSAAEASACLASQDLFWPFHDRLFESTGELSEEALREHAVAVGADVDAYTRCVEEGSQRAVVEADMAAAREIGISGTPAFLVNGTLLTGAQPVEAFTRAIDRELAAAEEARSKTSS